MAASPSEPDLTTTSCSTCVIVGRRGYCARGRCYCGHRECWAFDSYVELVPVKDLVGVEASALATPTRRAKLCPNGRPIATDGECCGRRHP